MTNKGLIVLFLICILMLSVSTGYGKNPMTYYQQAESLKQEALKDRQAGKLEYALNICKAALARLEVIKNKYPNWESMPTLVNPLIEEYKRLTYSIKSQIQVRRGYAYQRQGKYEEALKEYNLVLDKYKDELQSNVMAQGGIGEIYYVQGKYAEAFKEYSIILEKYKDQPRTSALAQGAIGNIYTLMGNYEDALKAYNIVLSKYKDQIDACVMAQYGIGEIYQRMGKYEDAKVAWQKLVDEHKDHPYVRLIKVLLELVPIESWQDMREEYKNGLPIILNFFLGRISEKEFLVSFINLNKEFENDAACFIAIKYQMEDRLDKAKGYYQKCIDISKNKDFAYSIALKALEKIK